MSVVGITAAQVLESTPAATPAEGQAATPAETAPPQDPKISQQFAALSKKEKQLFHAREALKKEQADFAAEKARVADLQAKYGNKPKSPREALERYGFDYKQATDYELNDGNPTAEQIARAAQQDVELMRKEQADRDRMAAERAAKDAEDAKAQVVQEFKTEIQGFVEEKGDEYELIKFNSAYEVVYLTIEEHYNKTGRLLSIPEGANMVEKYLEKRWEEAQKLKKIAKTRQADPQTPDPSGNRQAQGLELVPAQRRTLDNAATASTSPTLIRSPRVEEDRMARALAALNK